MTQDYTKGLSKKQIERFEEQGCLCLENFLTPQEVELLLHTSKQLLENLDLSDHPMTKFTTEDDNHIGDDYFLQSSDKISYFFEKDAFDNNGNLKSSKEKSINKIGHSIHNLNPQFEKVSTSEKVKAIAKSLQFNDPRLIQSMIICKQSKIGGEVPPHTDSQFLYTDPLNLCGFWFALEDCTVENGCLSYNAGSHLKYPVSKRFVKLEQGGCGFIDLPIDKNKPILSPPKDEDYKLVECKAGSLVLINHSVLHKSNNNTSDKSRFAYVFHVIEGEAEYDNLNWLQVPPSGGTNFSKLY